MLKGAGVYLVVQGTNKYAIRRAVGSPFRATAAPRHTAYRMFAQATAQPGDFVVVDYTGRIVLWYKV